MFTCKFGIKKDISGKFTKENMFLFLPFVLMSKENISFVQYVLGINRLNIIFRALAAVCSSCLNLYMTNLFLKLKKKN